MILTYNDFMPKDNFSDEVTEYHRIDCPKLWELYKARRDEGKTCDYLSFISKEVKFDKSYDKANAKFQEYKKLTVRALNLRIFTVS